MICQKISLATVCFLIICLQMVSGRATKEVYMESDLTVKATPSQDDLTQFFKDQPHLAEAKDENPDSENFGNPQISGNLGRPTIVTQVTDANGLSSMLGNLGLPIIVSPSDIGQLLISAPFGLFTQMIGGYRESLAKLSKQIIRQ